MPGKKKTPKKPSKLPDDSSGNASPSVPYAGAERKRTEKSLVESPAPSVGECKEVRSSDRALQHNEIHIG